MTPTSTNISEHEFVWMSPEGELMIANDLIIEWDRENNIGSLVLAFIADALEQTGFECLGPL